MDARELMIGDWARIRYNHFETGEEIVKDFRVGQLAKLGLGDDEPLYVWSEKSNMDKVSKVEPIPLTPEILEKNFGSALNGCYFEGDEFYELMIHEVNDGTWIIKHDNIEFSNIPRQQVMVGYVHEFQRALRCFGLFYLANNFKI